MLLASKQLLDILASHVCSNLRPADLQSLGQTCTVLRTLVSEGLPAIVWEQVAAKCLPAAHPILSLPGHEMCDYLDRISRAKAVLPEPTCLGEPGPTHLSEGILCTH